MCRWLWRFGWLTFGVASALSVIFVVTALSTIDRPLQEKDRQVAAARAALSQPTPTVSRPVFSDPFADAVRLRRQSRLAEALRLFPVAASGPREGRVLADVFAEWSRALLVWGDAPGALTKIDRALELEPAGPDLHSWRCLVLDWNARYTDAIRSCQRALELAPANAPAHAYLAETFADLGQIEQALGEARKAVDLDERPFPHADVQRGYGYVLQAAGRFDEAEQAFRRAIAVAPDDVHYRFSLARFFRARGDHQRAVVELQPLADAFPDNPQVFTELGLALYQQKKYREATPFFAESVRLDGERAAPRSYLGWSLYLQEQYPQALPHFQAAVRLDARRIESLTGLGWTHYALKSYDEALDAFARVLAIDASNESAKKGLLAVEENRGRVTGAR